MRTTVEIDESQRAELLKIAAQRGDKGFSRIVREALDAFLEHHRARRALVAQALKLQGAFGDDEADALEESVRQVRVNWRRSPRISARISTAGIRRLEWQIT